MATPDEVEQALLAIRIGGEAEVLGVYWERSGEAGWLCHMAAFRGAFGGSLGWAVRTTLAIVALRDLLRDPPELRAPRARR